MLSGFFAEEEEDDGENFADADDEDADDENIADDNIDDGVEKKIEAGAASKALLRMPLPLVEASSDEHRNRDDDGCPSNERGRLHAAGRTRDKERRIAFFVCFFPLLARPNCDETQNEKKKGDALIVRSLAASAAGLLFRIHQRCPLPVQELRRLPRRLSLSLRSGSRRRPGDFEGRSGGCIEGRRARRRR